VNLFINIRLFHAAASQLLRGGITLQEAPAMRHDFDVFEKFPDGSTLWRACIAGRYEAHRKMQELAEHSENEFYAIDLQTIKNLPAIPRRNAAPDERPVAG
jgi:hypothetical protein